MRAAVNCSGWEIPLEPAESGTTEHTPSSAPRNVTHQGATRLHGEEVSEGAFNIYTFLLIELLRAGSMSLVLSNKGSCLNLESKEWCSGASQSVWEAFGYTARWSKTEHGGTFP